MSIWLDWSELNKRAKKKKKIFLYGRSEDWVHKALKSFHETPSGIIDRDPTYEGTAYFGLKVSPLESLTDLNECFFVITAGEFEGITDLLDSRGLVAGIDYCCSPDFQDYRFIKDFHASNFELLIASSDYNDQSRARSSRMGGGIYKFNTKTGHFERLVKGSIRQFGKYENAYLAVDYVDRQLLWIESDFSIKLKLSLPKANYCGLAIDEENAVAYIANAGDDSVLVVTNIDTMCPKISDELLFLNRRGMVRESHLNDLEFYEGKLFFSYFSKSGNYKLGAFDGGVSHFDLRRNVLEEESISKLWKPHSPKVINEKLWVLDSMRGSLKSAFGDEYYNFGGFVRGLGFKDGIFFIGQSQDMYISDRVSQGAMVSGDSGVYLFDIKSKAYRFLPINKIMNIHDIKVLNDV